MNTLEEATKKVVEFWIEKSFRTALNQNNGDDTPNGGMAFALMNMNSAHAQKTITEERIEMFREKLTELILSATPQERAWLDVDYHPCEMLRIAADYAGLNHGCFPCKSMTQIDRDNIAKGKYQYGGKLIEL